MNKKSLLLFKNAFKQTFRNKIQLVGLIVLVLLSSTIFSLMQTSLSRISNEYSILISNDPHYGSNLHDFVIDLSETAAIGTIPPTPGLEEKSNIIINNIANEIDNSFIWDRVEGRALQLDNDGNQRVLKLLTYNNSARVDRLVINEGYTIGDVNNPDKLTPVIQQTVINKEFAKKNNLHIGDVIRVQKDQLGTSLKVNYDINNPIYSIFNWLKIVGFGTSADFTTPIIDQTTPIPNKTREGILYVDSASFGLSSVSKDNNFFWSYDKQLEHFSISSQGDREIYYVGKWNHGQNNSIGYVSARLRNTYVSTIDAEAKLVYNLGDSDYRFNSRTSILTGTITGFTTLLIALLLVVLIITGITVVLITYKNIENSRTQIGILKSLGYSNIKILITSLAYPMVAAFIGTILVFLPASGFQIIIINTFANYFNLDFGNFIFDALGFLYCLILTFGFLSIITWIISALTVIQNPIKLIKNESVTVNSGFTRAVKRVSIHRGFLTRFRLALFTSSIGKMAAASLTMFLGTTLMTTAIIGPKIMADNKLLSFTGMNYKSLVEYNIPTYNSPYTFYQTYDSNPKTKPWDYKTLVDVNSTYVRPLRGDENNGEFVKEILDNNINSEAYAPMTFASVQSALTTLGLFNLSYLNGKMFTKSFLNGLDSSDANDADLISTIVLNAWPLAWPIYEDALHDINVTSYYSDITYNLLRKFYQDYRSTVAMNISGAISKTGNLSNNPDDFDNALFNTFADSIVSSGDKNIPAYDNVSPNGADTFEATINNFQFNQSDKNYPWHVTNENEILTNVASQLPAKTRDNWINKLGVWFGALFYNRIGQTVVQGTYSRAPYFIRQNIANSYSDPDSPFNVSFNVLPFEPKTDELGTYFVGEPDKRFNGYKYPIKVYGLQNQQQLGRPSMMQLYDSGGNALNPLLENNDGSDTTNIVINETIAKQLNLYVNDPIMMATNGNIMEFKNNPDDDYTSININDVDFKGIVKDVAGKKNNVTLNKNNTAFTQVTGLDEYTYNAINNASKMLKKNVAGNVVTTGDNTFTKYKVVGIYNGYGQPNAYISKTNADKILHYNDKTINNTDSRSMLFRIFQMEWKNEATWNGVDFSVLNAPDMNYAKFVNDPHIDPNLVKVFDNEYPIFNFKLSNSELLPDITNSFSTSQVYGDYSPFGLNGGVDTTSSPSVAYEGYGVGSAVNVSPLYVHHQLLSQITALVDAVLVVFIVLSLIISFFIILLTSNLVIYENRKVIATMKTLGYSDSKITNIVIGMYLPLILTMFVLGFPIGWVIVTQVVGYLALNTVWVLPLIFTWWLPFVIAGFVLGIYGATFMIGWNSMKKLNPIKTLNEID